MSRLALLCLALVLAIEQAQAIHKSDILYTFYAMHVFSSHSHEDQFELTVRGDNFFDSEVTFRIISWQHKEIYRHQFSMGELMEFGPIETDKAYRRDKDDSIMIRYQLSHFFDDDRFDSPAIRDTADMQPNLLPREDWWEIYEDQTSVGFYYQLGAEDGRGIAWSIHQKKVIHFYACC
jgi:hypothetical protein